MATTASSEARLKAPRATSSTSSCTCVTLLSGITPRMQRPEDVRLLARPHLHCVGEHICCAGLLQGDDLVNRDDELVLSSDQVRVVAQSKVRDVQYSLPEHSVLIIRTREPGHQRRV
eukprot:751846-Hanusia_phi.AAC.3